MFDLWLLKANLECPIRFFVHFSKTLNNTANKMQHIVEFAFSSFQKWGHIDPNRSGIGLMLYLFGKHFRSMSSKYSIFVDELMIRMIFVVDILREYAD